MVTRPITKISSLCPLDNPISSCSWLCQTLICFCKRFLFIAVFVCPLHSGRELLHYSMMQWWWYLFLCPPWIFKIHYVFCPTWGNLFWVNKGEREQCVMRVVLKFVACCCCKYSASAQACILCDTLFIVKDYMCFPAQV